MELNWELCRIFYQVARCRNFSRAAAMLFTSQPAVSRSMAALERELGCRLFIRNRRGVELTPEGRMFYAHVEAGCEQFRRGRGSDSCRPRRCTPGRPCSICRCTPAHWPALQHSSYRVHPPCFPFLRQEMPCCCTLCPPS